MPSLHCGDCLEVMAGLESNSIDTILTDPPYGIKFKNQKWDYSIPSVHHFEEMLRVSKPGATMLCFGGTRTFHRMAINIEDAGWYISDTICWLYGQGFPKSVDVSYAIDKAAGKFGAVKQNKIVGPIMERSIKRQNITLYEPSSEDAKRWYGYGTALKPAFEPIIRASKRIEGNYDENAIKHGVCGLWIDGARIEDPGYSNSGIQRTADGRWPSNVIVDPLLTNQLESQHTGASKFFYCPKVSSKERAEMKHSTMKPLKLIKYLCTLTKTPTGGVVLDPYAGTGTTAIACIDSGRDYIVIEEDKSSYLEMKTRIESHENIR